ncbi:hypothetical protein BBJ28_00007835 [Nothophytophthora sp. Chile5]|nr:hypothetical protein BBJ28_00007835 [Nothophytophthora sp. Chile5]
MTCAVRGAHKLPTIPATMASTPSKVDVMRQYFVTSHGLALYIRKWLPRFDCIPRGVVFLVHGLGEHGGRYEHMARILAKRGFAVLAVDHQGHGLSDGERLYAGKLAHLTEDYMEFIRHVLEGPQPGDKNGSILDGELEAHANVNWGRLPRFLFGHSMGGVITLQLVEQSQQQNLVWNGVVLSSAALWCVPGGGCPTAVRLASYILPKFTLPPIEFATLGDDVDVFNRWVRDPLRAPYGATLQLGVSLLTEGWRLTRPDADIAKTFPAPLYMLHGELDTLTYPQGSVAFYTACCQQDKTLNIIPRTVHEVFNLEGHEKVLHEIVGWVEARLN